MDFVKSLAYPKEIIALLHLMFGRGPNILSKLDLSKMSPTLRQCFALLNKTARTYSVGLEIFEGELRNVFCIFYLVLRALDTIEDDMTIPKDTKVQMLKSFYKNLEDPDWKFCESKDKDKIVLENFPVVSKEYRNLKKVYRDNISHACQEMGEGMAIFMTKQIDTLSDLDEYSHYVSGVVCICSLKMVYASGLEQQKSDKIFKVVDSIGTMLQKTVIIRDFIEDLGQNQTFWPKCVWNKYVSEIGDLTKPENREKAMQCLNEMITSALEALPSVIALFSCFKTQNILTCLAVSQMMNFVVLERCYNNPALFNAVVKVRRGEVARIIMASTSLEQVRCMMREMIMKLFNKIPESDPSAAQTRAICQKALEAMWTPQQQSPTVRSGSLVYISFGVVIIGITITGCSQIFQLWETFW